MPTREEACFSLLCQRAFLTREIGLQNTCATKVSCRYWHAAALQARWESCYQHVMVQLKYLLSPGSVDASAPAVQRVQHLGTDDQQALRRVLLQVWQLTTLACHSTSSLHGSNCTGSSCPCMFKIQAAHWTAAQGSIILRMRDSHVRENACSIEKQ